MAHIGIYGGTFNPIHNGHLHLLREADRVFDFDRILVIPANIPPHKRAPDLASGADRLEMARLAALAIPKVSVSDIELRAKGKSYTILTLEKLHTLFPEDRFTLLMGADMLLTFDKWYRFTDILKLCAIGAIARGPGEEALLLEKAETLEKITVIQAAPLPMSSTALREDLRLGKDVSGFLPDGVLSYIQKKGLYRK